MPKRNLGIIQKTMQVNEKRFNHEGHKEHQVKEKPIVFVSLGVRCV
jgi:hypothetical protein